MPPLLRFSGPSLVIPKCSATGAEYPSQLDKSGCCPRLFGRAVAVARGSLPHSLPRCLSPPPPGAWSASGSLAEPWEAPLSRLLQPFSAKRDGGARCRSPALEEERGLVRKRAAAEAQRTSKTKKHRSRNCGCEGVWSTFGHVRAVSWNLPEMATGRVRVSGCARLRASLWHLGTRVRPRLRDCVRGGARASARVRI
jgi:hypothetical protein